MALHPERLWLGFTSRKRREKATVGVVAARWPLVWCERRKDGRDGEKMAVIGAAAIAGMEATAETMAWENLWVPGCSFARHSILGPSDHPRNESVTFGHRWRSVLLFLSLGIWAHLYLYYFGFGTRGAPAMYA